MDTFDDIRYYQPPAFTLDNFIFHISEMQNMPLRKVREAITSKHNYKKIANLLAKQYINPTVQEEVHVQQFTPESKKLQFHFKLFSLKMNFKSILEQK